MTSQDQIELQSMINEAVVKGIAEGVARAHGECRFVAVDPSIVGHIMEDFRELGDGDVLRGIHISRDNNKALSKIRRLGENVGGKITVWMCIAIIGGIVALMGWGVISKVSEIAAGGPR